MGLFDGLSTPKWMSPSDLSIASAQGAGNAGQLFGAAFRQAQGAKQDKEMIDYKVAAVKKQQQDTAAKFLPVANELSKANSPSEAWQIASQHPQWMADPQVGPFVENFLQTQEKVAAAELSTIAGRNKIADTSDFAKRVSEVDAETRAALKSMTPNKDGTPSAMQWQALGLAEERTKLAQENRATAAGIDALKRGDTVTTTVTDKGISTTYKPPSAAEANLNVAPKTLDIGGGKTLAWMPGGKTLHVVSSDGKKAEYTASQMESIAKGLDDEDPRKAQIQNFLANTAVAQTTNSVPSKIGRFLVTPQ